MKRIIKIIICSSLLICLCSCGESKDNKDNITIVYQSSVGYAPLIVMKELGILEKNYKKDISIDWKEMKNGSEINEGLVSGSIDIGSMGVPVAITGIMSGCNYKISSALSSQPYSILTSDENINTLSDIGEHQIAITNINSQPHILLSMACKKILGDSRALDKNLVVLSNADGYSAMISGAIDCQIVISPYNFMELNSKEKNIHEISIDNNIWGVSNTTLVTVASENLYKNNQELYDAFIYSLKEADNYINNNKEETANILSRYYDASSDEIYLWMNDERSSYNIELNGVMDLAEFMYEEKFLSAMPTSIKELVYDNVKGN